MPSTTKMNFDIEGAAEYLGVSVNTAKHHVINGALRYAALVFYSSSMKVVSFGGFSKDHRGNYWMLRAKAGTANTVLLFKK